MKWTYRIDYKFSSAIILGVICLLVTVKTIVERNNLAKLEDSFDSVYEDRLLPESYIFRLSEHLHQKINLMENPANDPLRLKAEIGLHDLAINALIIDYEKTKLTVSEEIYFSEFKKSINGIAVFEENISGVTNEVLLQSTARLYNNAFGNLQHLSGIQIAEGHSLNESSKRIMAGSAMLTELELVLLICAGAALHGLVLASKSIIPTRPQNHSLN
jgi:hypothetical protein